MPNSVREDIIAHIATALGNVTTGNGYENTLASVQRFQQAGLTVATVPTAVVTFVNETKDIGPDFRATCELDVSIDIWAVHDTDAVSGDTATLVDSLAADCEKAVMADTGRGGKARDTAVRSITPFRLAEGQPFVGSVLSVTVFYAHAADDPFTVR